MPTKYDRVIEYYTDKYKNYYPITPCIQDESTPFKKYHSMCSYCYSCYVELCETICRDYGFEIPLKYTHSTLEKLCCKVNFKLIKLYSQDYPIPIYIEVQKLVEILNKYTSYSKVESKKNNMLHREFIEAIIEPLNIIIWDYLLGQSLSGNYNYKRNNIIKKRNALYKLNIFCFEVYYRYIKRNFKYNYFADNIALEIVTIIYEKNKGKNK